MAEQSIDELKSTAKVFLIRLTLVFAVLAGTFAIYEYVVDLQDTKTQQSTLIFIEAFEQIQEQEFKGVDQVAVHSLTSDMQTLYELLAAKGMLVENNIAQVAKKLEMSLETVSDPILKDVVVARLANTYGKMRRPDRVDELLNTNNVESLLVAMNIAEAYYEASEYQKAKQWLEVALSLGEESNYKTLLEQWLTIVETKQKNS